MSFSIAIDGPAASGKSTVAERIARELDLLYFDTGVMYRAVTLAALNGGLDAADQKSIEHLAEAIEIDVRPPSKGDGRQYDVILDGEDVTWEIRTDQVNAHVSQVSTYRGVREAMTQKQREIGIRNDVVMVGRDIGTVVLPDADLKFYLDASTEERAKRRFEEERNRGIDVQFDALLAAMKERDRIDSTRELAPLKSASDAIIIDTSDLSIEDVVRRVIQNVRSKTQQG